MMLTLPTAIRELYANLTAGELLIVFGGGFVISTGKIGFGYLQTTKAAARHFTKRTGH
jgi:hypothetical protein